jgi:hypothetical protein
VSTAHDATTLFSGRNVLTGEKVGLGGRIIAFAGLASPLGAGQIRAASNLVTGAARALAGRIGRNSVEVAIEGGFKRIDLVGKAHKGVATPHVHTYMWHENPATGVGRFKKEFAGPATRQDIIEAARTVGQ